MKCDVCRCYRFENSDHLCYHKSGTPDVRRHGPKDDIPPACYNFWLKRDISLGEAEAR